MWLVSYVTCVEIFVLITIEFKSKQRNLDIFILLTHVGIMCVGRYF